MEPVTICSIINAVAIVALVIVTWRYVHHTKQLVEETRLARRDNPELRASLSEPSQEDIARRHITKPAGTFLTFIALLINPGSVPIVIDNVTEEVNQQESKGFEFALPKHVRPEQLSLYTLGVPWVISRDSFAIWSRYLKLDSNKDNTYTLTVKFDYSVGGKPKKPVIAGPLSLTPKQ